MAISPTDGYLYVVDHCTYTIRQVSPGGFLTTIASKWNVTSPLRGFVDGPAHIARFMDPTSLAVSAHGKKYMSLIWEMLLFELSILIK
jgi:hypothetical protein